MKKLIVIFCMTVSLYFFPEKVNLNRIDGEWVSADSAAMPMRFMFIGDHVHIFPDLSMGSGPELREILDKAALGDSLTAFTYKVVNDTMYCSRAMRDTIIRPPVCKIFVSSGDTLGMWERFSGQVTLYARRR